jgi:hydroxymethylpyrimidine pyrophosphatase-like HAD family hydrolase
VRVLYVDVDGTLVGPGGDLLWDGSTRIVDALLRARTAGLDIVPVTGRGRVQVFELCRLLGLPRGIGELGCVHVEGREVRYELGDFPFVGRTPVEAMHDEGAIEFVLQQARLEPHEPWNVGREATYLLRGEAEPDAVNAALVTAGFAWCRLIDNGLLRRAGNSTGRVVGAYHLAPTGTGKATGVRIDRERHRIDATDTAYIGDSPSDLECAHEVAQCWLVANAAVAREWPHRTTGAFGAGVAELIDVLLQGA